MNTRNDFRAENVGGYCEMYSGTIIERAKIQNISGTGMNILVFDDKFGRYLTVRFYIGEKVFFRKAEITRKMYLQTRDYEFGLKFIGQTETERETLHSALVSHTARYN